MGFLRSGQSQITVNGVTLKLPKKEDLCNLLAKWADEDRQSLLKDLADAGADASQKLEHLRKHASAAGHLRRALDCISGSLPRLMETLLLCNQGVSLESLTQEDMVNTALVMWGYEPIEDGASSAKEGDRPLDMQTT